MLDRLPDDVLIRCLSYLRAKDVLSNIQCLNRRILELSAEDRLWKSLYKSKQRKEGFRQAYLDAKRPKAISKFKRTWKDWAVLFLAIITTSDVISDNIIIVRFALDGEWQWFTASFFFIALHTMLLCI